MRIIECTKCGSSELAQNEGFVQCVYCQSRFVLEAAELLSPSSTIGVVSDIERLLERCRTDPANRRRYASLVLDIDPTNAEAIQFLR
jgi:hypothetical protein